MTDVYRRLAENDGARFHQAAETGRWIAEDKDGVAIVSHSNGALSIAEAARHYCEDKGLASPDEILDRIVAGCRPYDVLDEFWQGFKDCQRHGVLRCNRYRDDEGVRARAWDCGASAAIRYQQALVRRACTEAEADEVVPAWLVKLLRTGRR